MIKMPKKMITKAKQTKQADKRINNNRDKTITEINNNRDKATTEIKQ